MKSLFEGVGVALVTPFLNNHIDYISTRRLIEKHIKEGCSAIVALATTGEAPSITDDERVSFIKFCNSVIKHRVKLIVGTGNNNFEKCFSLTKQAKELGADGALIVTPYYNKTTQRGLVEFYKTLSVLQFPIIIYNVPARTGLSIELDTIKTLIKTNPYIYGIKESTCDINRIVKLHQICKNKIAVYSGEDELNFLFYCLGGNGTISVTANAFCKDVCDVFNLSKSEKTKLALEKQTSLSKVNNLMFCETNPIPIKHLLKNLRIIESDEVRLPLVELSFKNRIKIDRIKR